MAACDLTVFAGTQPAVDATFRNEDGQLADPTAITVTTTDPSGDVVVYNYPGAPEIAKNIIDEPIGVWRFTFNAALTETGTWTILVAGTAGVVVTAKTTIAVKQI
jgi:hypothetical protein